MTPTVSIVIVSYNTREMTLACIRSVMQETRDTQYQLLVVDNASVDGSAAAIAENCPNVRLWALEKNIGFAAANNLAAPHASGEWLLLLNPDTVVLDGAIDRLVKFGEAQSASDPSVGIFGGRTLFADGSLNPASCWGHPSVWGAFCYGTGLSSLFRRSRLFDPESLGWWPRDSVREVGIVTGCFLLLRRSLWQRLGGFAPEFFMYGEEADLCLRAHRLGYRCLINPEAVITHYFGASDRVRSERMSQILRAKAMLYARHWHPLLSAFAVTMIDCWAFSRFVCYRAMAWRSAAYAEMGRTWGSIWAQRDSWWRAWRQTARLT